LKLKTKVERQKGKEARKLLKQIHDDIALIRRSRCPNLDICRSILTERNAQYETLVKREGL
jgi:hypothetical protein